MMEQQINICKGKTMLKRAEDINEEINDLIAEDKIRKEAENNQKLKEKINDLSNLLEEAKQKRQRYAVDYERILFEYPETKSYLEALGYTIVYIKGTSKYCIAFDKDTAKIFENRNKKYLRFKSITYVFIISLWIAFFAFISYDFFISLLLLTLLIPATFAVMSLH